MDKDVTILVVDSDPEVLKATKRTFAEAYTVIEASSGEECLRMAKEGQPDVILLAVAMPDISGVDLCKQIKRDPQMAGSYVVLVAGQGTPSGIQARGLEAGADGYFVRPMPNRELLARVEAMLRRKRATAELRSTLGEVQATLDAIQDAVYVVDLQGFIVRCNLALAKMLRKSLSEIIGRPCYQVVHGTARPIEACLLTRVQESRQRESLIVPLGQRWLQVTVDPLLDEAGRLLGGVHVMSDVTERKANEETSQQERHMLSVIVNQSGIPVLVLDVQGRIVRFNRACEQISGYSLNDVRGRPIWDVLVPADEVERVKSIFSGLLAGHFAAEYEGTWITKDGRRRLISWTNTAVLDSAGALEFVAASGTDITEHRSSEQSLRDERDLLTGILQQTGPLVMLLDAEGRIVRFSRACEQASGYTHAEVQGKYVWDLLAPEEADGYKAAFAAALAEPSQERSAEQEHWWLTRQGSLRRIAWSNSAIFDPDGKVQYVVVSGTDVTERRLAHDALQASCERYQRASESAGDWLYDWDMATGQVQWRSPDARAEERLGYSAAGLPAHTEAWEGALHPDDRERVVAALQEHVTTGQPFAQEYRILTPDGQVRHWLDRGAVLKDRHDRPQRRVGVVTDITARKQAEQALAASEEGARTLLGVVASEATLVDGAGTILALNAAAAEHLGASSAELVGLRLYDLLPSEAAAARQAQVESVLRTGQPVHGLDESEGKCCLVTLHPVADSQGRPTHVAIWTDDVTLRKRAQEEWLAAQMELGHAQQLEGVRLLASSVAGDLATLSGQLQSRAAPPALELHALDLNAWTREWSDGLRQVLEGPIHLQVQLAPVACQVLGDASALRQAATYLARSAQHALARGGTLRIETARAMLDEAYCQSHPEAAKRLAGGEARAGGYARLSVTAAGLAPAASGPQGAFRTLLGAATADPSYDAAPSLVRGVLARHNGWYEVTGDAAQIDIYLPLVPGERST